MNKETQNHDLASKSKSTLARLLAKENITIRHVAGADTATFNVETRVLELPIWKENISEDLYDMLVIHEVGHALDTDLKEWITAIDALGEKHCPADKPWMLNDIKRSIHSFVNILEDIRIDANQRYRYPGSKRNYAIGYKELYDSNFFKTEGKKLSDFPFIDRINLASKAGYSGVYIPFSEEEKKIFTRANNTKTLSEVVSLAEELWFMEKAKHSENKQNSGENKKTEKQDSDSESAETDKSFSDGDEKSESGKPSDDYEIVCDQEQNRTSGKEKQDDSDKSDSGSDESDTDSESSDSNDTGDDAGDETGEKSAIENDDLIPPEAFAQNQEAAAQEKTDKKSKSKNRRDHFGGFGGGSSANNSEKDENYIPESETSGAMEDSMKALVDKNAHGYYYSVIPDILELKIRDYKDVINEHKEYQKIVPLKPSLIEYTHNFRKKESKSISFMVKEFEMRKAALSYSKTNIAKTGVINTNKLHSYVFNDDIFKRNLTEQKGKNHGFVMFIDNSGSMASCFEDTLKQLYSLIMFCKRIQVPFEVYSFTSGSVHFRPSVSADYKISFTGGDEYLTFNDTNIRIRNMFSSKMKPAELDFMMASMLAMYHHESNDKSNNSYQISPHYYNPPFEAQGGTPLNETILAAEKLVDNFKKKNNVEICNIIFLTDGEGASPTLGSNLYTTNTKSYNIVIQDKKTKNEYILPTVSSRHNYSNQVFYNNGFDWTNMMLRVLKDRTKANLVGFYIIDSHRGYRLDPIILQGKSQYLSDRNVDSGFENIDLTKSKKQLSNDGFVEIKNSGYDEYFLINTKSLDTDTEEFKVKDASEKTVNKISKEFNKYLEKKVNNRKLLTTFIKKIA